MKIKLLDYGYQNAPKRAHDNDAGADVYSTISCMIKPQETVKVPLGFGVEIPDGYAGFIFPRSGLSAKGICAQLPPIDSGYRGQVHAILTNYGTESFNIFIGDRIGQLVVVPCVICDFVTERSAERGIGAFGSTGA